MESTSQLGRQADLRLLKAKRGQGQINIRLPGRAGLAQCLGCLFWSSALVLFSQERVKSTSAGQGFACHFVVPTRRGGNVERLRGKGVKVAEGLSVALGQPGALPLPKQLPRQQISCGTPKVSGSAGNSLAGTNTDLA